MLEMYKKFRDGTAMLRDLPPLGMRLILAYGFMGPAMMKLQNFDGIVMWFGSLGIPLPWINAVLATATETAGFVLIFLGLGTRLIAVPMIGVMVVAILTVHLDGGWLAIASSEMPEIAQRLEAAREILKEYGNYQWLTEKGSFVILQNGMEFPVTYIVMLLSLMVTGPGRISLDHFLDKKLGLEE